MAEEKKDITKDKNNNFDIHENEIGFILRPLADETKVVSVNTIKRLLSTYTILYNPLLNLIAIYYLEPEDRRKIALYFKKMYPTATVTYTSLFVEIIYKRKNRYDYSRDSLILHLIKQAEKYRPKE